MFVVHSVLFVVCCMLCVLSSVLSLSCSLGFVVCGMVCVSCWFAYLLVCLFACSLARLFG